MKRRRVGEEGKSEQQVEENEVKVSTDDDGFTDLDF